MWENVFSPLKNVKDLSKFILMLTYNAARLEQLGEKH